MDQANERFAVGLFFAWAPWIPTLTVVAHEMRGISETKATGLGVIVGDISEVLILWGLITMAVTQMAAIIWLSRSLSREHAARSLLSVLSIGLSAAMLALMCGFIWAVWFLARR